MTTDTEKEQEIQALKDELHQQQSLLRAIDEATPRIEFDPRGKILFANKLFCDAMGYTSREVVGKHHRIFMFPEDADNSDYKRHWDELARGNLQAGEFRRRNKAGQEVYIFATYASVKDQTGRVTKIVKCARDVTDRLQAIATMGEAMQRLAQGDLTRGIDNYMSEDFKSLRMDFNDARLKLGGAFSSIVAATNDIRDTSASLSSQSNVLSNSSESQSSALDSTATEISSIVDLVERTSTGVLQAKEMVQKTKDQATSGMQIMAEAQTAMDQIASSASEISKITSVIDQISFQTNLLALNAGVEAARAGDAGRGFSVVASEVRALAQRSSDAATQIANLIAASGTQVKTGVELVSRTGDSLSDIGQYVTDVLDRVQEISQDAHAQSAGLKGIADQVRTLQSETNRNRERFSEAQQETEKLQDHVHSLTLSTDAFSYTETGHQNTNLRRRAS